MHRSCAECFAAVMARPGLLGLPTNKDSPPLLRPMKLWDKGQPLDAAIEAFTVGRDRELDLQLAPFDVQGSIAHARMLRKVGLLEAGEDDSLVAGLLQIAREISAGDFTIPPGVEDVHSRVEQLLTERLGEVGKKLHSGRSRNDQVLVDLRLFYRHRLDSLAAKVGSLVVDLLARSEAERATYWPGFTHTQVAMVSSAGMWLGAYAETLIDDLRLLGAARAIANQNPLGTAAGFGSSFPLDRAETTRRLGFSDQMYNSVGAHLSRGKTELQCAYAIAGLAHTLGRLANDVVWYCNQNLALVRLPEAATTGSSIMPHKRNPDVFELLRARANRLATLPAAIQSLTSNLLGGYHRDYQLLKEELFPGFAEAESLLAMLSRLLPDMSFIPANLQDDKYTDLFTVEEVNRLVVAGTPFRDAYRAVAKTLAEGTFTPDRMLHHTHDGSLGNLRNDAIAAKLTQALQAFPEPVLGLG